MTIFITGHHHLSLWLASVLTYIFIWYNQEIAIDNKEEFLFYEEEGNFDILKEVGFSNLIG